MSAITAPATDRVSDRIVELLSAFKLPTAAREMVPRLRSAGHGDLLPDLLEILELEAGDRRERRVDRLLRASKLPPGKTFTNLDDKRFPPLLSQKLRELARGDFVEQSVNVLAF